MRFRQENLAQFQGWQGCTAAWVELQTIAQNRSPSHNTYTGPMSFLGDTPVTGPRSLLGGGTPVLGGVP